MFSYTDLDYLDVILPTPTQTQTQTDPLADLAKQDFLNQTN